MSFYQEAGVEIDGSEKNSHVQSFSVIPEGTQAAAMIKSATAAEIEGVPQHYEVIWKLTSGDFKGQEVKQKINCFDQDAKKRARAKNMLVRLFKLSNATPTHSNAPNDADLKPLVGKVAGIMIREWAMPKKDGSGMSEGNWISEVHAVTPEFQTISGIKQVHTV